MMNIVALHLKAKDIQQAVINDLKKYLPTTTIIKQFNKETYPKIIWVESSAGYQELLAIKGVVKVTNYNDACSCGSGELKEALHDARGIFCCYYCYDCEQEKRARYRTDVLEDSDYVANEEIEPDYDDGMR